MTRLAAILLLALVAGAAPSPLWAAKPKPPPAEAPPPVPPPPPAPISGAELQGLDKISGRVTKFTAAFNQKVRFGTLEIDVTDCRKAPPEDPPESAAFLEIQDLRGRSALASDAAVSTTGVAEAGHQVFRGWMFASSPALNSLEHPVYDVWVLDCSTASGSSTPPG
jgi:hypothetical protein